MTKQHTPGPWFVTPDGAAVYEKDGFGYRAETICGLPSRSDSRAANARLIAAAPDLLATLLNTADALEQLMREGTFKPWADYTPHARDLIANARAAIARATGD
jgi:hypothetical protein